ncbi:MAG: hypothetical protein H7X77_11245, partial [Anaerolineae bacterium]|nr:hypothetical protein [Anaerolineae bacterium]
TAYPFEARLEAIHASEQMLITDAQNLPTLAWTQDKQGILRANRTRYAYVEGSLALFSPDGRYSFIMCWTEGGNPDYPYYVLYEGQTELYEIGLQVRPVWLGTSAYFVQGNSLYHPASAEPIDRLNDFQIEGLVDETELGIWSEYLGGESVSDDGRWYMQILGATALVVPVNLAD